MRQTLLSARAKNRREPSVANSVNAGLPAGVRATTLPSVRFRIQKSSRSIRVQIKLSERTSELINRLLGSCTANLRRVIGTPVWAVAVFPTASVADTGTSYV